MFNCLRLLCRAVATVVAEVCKVGAPVLANCSNAIGATNDHSDFLPGNYVRRSLTFPIENDTWETAHLKEFNSPTKPQLMINLRTDNYRTEPEVQNMLL